MQVICFLILFILSTSTLAFADPVYNKIIHKMFPDDVISESFLVGFKSKLTGQRLEYYQSNQERIKKIVNEEYTNYIVEKVSVYISKELTVSEADEVLKYLNTPSGKIMIQVFMSKEALKLVTADVRLNQRKFNETNYGKKFNSLQVPLNQYMKKYIYERGPHVIKKLSEHFKNNMIQTSLIFMDQVKQ